MALEIVYVDPDDLIAAEYNPRAMTPDEAAALRDSIQHFGMVDPVICNSADERHNVVIGGHQRLNICWELGYKTVPVVYVDIPEIERERELNLRLNKNLGHWDEDLLRAFSEDELANVGFSDEEIDALFDLSDEKLGLTDPDDAPEAPESPVTIEGDVWVCGDHRVACGDATVHGVALRATGGEEADMLFTDPPYGVEYVGKTKQALTIENDRLGDDGTYALVLDALSIVPLATGAPFYICSPPGVTELAFRLAIRDAGHQLRQCLIWVKDRFVLGRSDYHYRHEPILTGTVPNDVAQDDVDDVTEHDAIFYGWKAGRKHYFISDRKQDTVWEYPRPAASRLHPTMKPIALVERAITNSSHRGALVLDLFGGSGTTMIACERTARRSALVELDPVYVDVIVRRWCEYTGKDAVREADGILWSSLKTRSTAGV